MNLETSSLVGRTNMTELRNTGWIPEPPGPPTMLRKRLNNRSTKGLACLQSLFLHTVHYANKTIYVDTMHGNQPELYTYCLMLCVWRYHQISQLPRSSKENESMMDGPERPEDMERFDAAEAEEDETRSTLDQV